MDGELVLDVEQRAVAARLRKVGDRVGRRRGRGVYLYGRPGRGKTMLMDRFFAGVESKRKRRYHFHGFFAGLHAAVAELGSIDRAVDAVLGDAELVCFDEFHVHDIGDAMLIARLLDVLFARSIVLVVTSNYAPDELLPNPLFHERFLPTIARIRAHLDVLAVDGPRDYRELRGRRTGFASGRYLVGAVACAAESAKGSPATTAPPHAPFPEGAPVDVAPPDAPLLEGSLIAAAPLEGSSSNTARHGSTTIPIAHRHLHAHYAENDCLIADFAELCGTPLAAADYLALTARYRQWTLCGVPELRTVPTDHVTRFVNLVDILYDADFPLTVHAAAPLPDLVRDVPHVPDLARIASRLGELPGGPELEGPR